MIKLFIENKSFNGYLIAKNKIRLDNLNPDDIEFFEQWHENFINVPRNNIFHEIDNEYLLDVKYKGVHNEGFFKSCYPIFEDDSVIISIASIVTYIDEKF